MKRKVKIMKPNNNKVINPSSFDDHPKSESCTRHQPCFFCIMEEQHPSVRRAKMVRFFKGSDLNVILEDLVLVLISLWYVAMAQPDDDEFPRLGIFDFLKGLIERATRDGSWLLRDQNIYVPYYASHVIGSYTMNRPEVTKEVVCSGIVPLMVELVRGKMSWVEQRVAVQALGHLASYEETFGGVAACEEKIVPLAMRVASTCIDTVYAGFVGLNGEKRPEYHRDMLTRWSRGIEVKGRRAEEWVSQLQCWSIYQLNSFATKGRGLHLICDEHGFLRELCETRGGIVNHNSPAGIRLLRILCRTRLGREKITDCHQVIDGLCNLARSSGDWQCMGIDCHLLLINNQGMRNKVMEIVTSCLLDLVDLTTLGRRSRLDNKISKALTLDRCTKYGERDHFTSREQIEEKRVLAKFLKDQGNILFRSRNIKGAISKYTKALDICPRNLRKERMVIHSNRGQCYLHLKEPDEAISDTTRALSLSRPTNSHGKSLWRRSQVYDMKGLAKESLVDRIMYVRWWFESKRSNNESVHDWVTEIIPYYAARMISKQMEATWLFRRSRSKMMMMMGRVKIYVLDRELFYCLLWLDEITLAA